VSSERQRAKRRAYKKRQRNGHVVLRVEVDEVGIVEALIAAGRVLEAESGDRHALEHALAELVEEWRRRWNGAE
jgi:hypothetical protein